MTTPSAPATLLGDAQRLSPKLTAWRRHLHAHPELSFEEHKTQAYVRRQLASLGCEDVRDIATTGLYVDVVGTQPGRAPSRRVALRADLDALPIQEVAGRAYGSTRAGVMHACGHDVHTTCALGAVALLRARRDQFCGSVRVIFQPGEELLPGGATHVIEGGGLEGVERIVGLHVAPSLAVGTYGLREGRYMASTDELHLRMRGGGGHAALAHRHTDLIATFAQLVSASQQVVSRKAPPDIPSVLSWGHVATTGGATNVLAAELHALGTFRTYDDTWRSRAHEALRKIVANSCAMFGADHELEIRRGYPALTNDVETTRAVSRALGALDPNVEIAALALRPTAEDFAWYLREVPGCFFRLGVRNERRGITAGVHQADFDVDEACLPYGAAGLAASALALLG